jgi:hypothetical protein
MSCLLPCYNGPRYCAQPKPTCASPHGAVRSGWIRPKQYDCAASGTPQRPALRGRRDKFVQRSPVWPASYCFLLPRRFAMAKILAADATSSAGPLLQNHRLETSHQEWHYPQKSARKDRLRSHYSGLPENVYVSFCATLAITEQANRSASWSCLRLESPRYDAASRLGHATMGADRIRSRIRGARHFGVFDCLHAQAIAAMPWHLTNTNCNNLSRNSQETDKAQWDLGLDAIVGNVGRMGKKLPEHNPVRAKSTPADLA